MPSEWRRPRRRDSPPRGFGTRGAAGSRPRGRDRRARTRGIRCRTRTPEGTGIRNSRTVSRKGPPGEGRRRRPGTGTRGRERKRNEGPNRADASSALLTGTAHPSTGRADSSERPGGASPVAEGAGGCTIARTRSDEARSMPANLTPQYKEAEQRFRRATSHGEKLETLREMLALLPKHKGTEKIQADLRHRIAKLEEEGEHARRAGPQRFDPGHVRREGAGQWVLIGSPNAGKSALVRALTHAHPEVAAYPFTTRVPLPGMMPFEDVQVQLVDTPAVAPHHTEPYLANLVHSADGILLVLDVTSDDVEESLHELLSVMERARVWPEGRPLPPDAPPFLLVKPAIAIGNKRDLDPDETFAALARGSIPPGITFYSVSAEHGAGLEDLRPTLFER